MRFEPPEHPERGSPLLRALADSLNAAGAAVIVRAGDDNLIRSRRADDGPGPAYLVIVEGLPNLLHEFVHAALAGYLADDHGIDYGLIPFDVTKRAGRDRLWDELACCVVSCAYLPRERAAPWFSEQVGIQGAFFGLGDLEDDMQPMFEMVDSARAAHPGEFEAMLARAYAEVERRLRDVGAGPELAQPVVRWSFDALWEGLRAAAQRS